RLRFSGPKTSIICSPMTSLKTSIKTITYLSDTGCLEIQGASLCIPGYNVKKVMLAPGAAGGRNMFTFQYPLSAVSTLPSS
ncbi:hypothetical protein, partial [Escherichia coli]|uniref:hypothetical protein n=1 Tax=Escherichia coli TaxID=562 RepID=UPI00356B6BA3